MPSSENAAKRPDHCNRLQPKQFVLDAVRPSGMYASPRSSETGSVLDPRRHYDRSVEDELRSHPLLGPRTLSSQLHQSTKLMAKPDYAGFATDKSGPYKNVLEQEVELVACEIGRELGLAS